MIILILLLILFIILIVVSKKCLDMVMYPIQYDFKHTRQSDIDEGFGGYIDDYDHKWNKRGFTLNVNNVSIKGDVITNDHPIDKKVAIFAHGHTANRISDLKYAGMFYEKGYHLVIFDERHFGNSTGDYCTLGQEEAKDLKEIYNYTKQIFGDDYKIVLQGESMGAATSLLVLQYINPDCVVVDCPFADSETLFKEFIKKNLHVPPSIIVFCVEIIAKLFYKYDIKKTSPIKAVKNTNVPICFMHGDNDNLIDCHHSKDMYAVCLNKNSEIHLFKGSDHARSVFDYRDEYKDIMFNFIEKNL